jgi:hypothetical protein
MWVFLVSKSSRPVLGPPSLLFNGQHFSFPGLERLGRDDHSPPSNVEVNEWSYTSTPPICLYVMDKDNFTFLPDWRDAQIIFEDNWSRNGRTAGGQIDFACENVCLWEEMCACERECVYVRGNVFLWEGMCACERECVHVRGNVCLLEGICACGRECVHVRGNVCLREGRCKGYRVLACIWHYITLEHKEVTTTKLTDTWQTLAFQIITDHARYVPTAWTVLQLQR